MQELEPRTLPSNSPGLPADPFLEASGITIRNGHGNGSPVLLQGTNLGGWLLSENWMAPRDSSGNLPDDYSERQTLINRFGATTANSLIAAYQQSWITTQDLDNFKGLGMNVVRVPFYYLDLVNADGSWRSDAYSELDWVVNNCAARGIYVLLDFHGVPGTQWANVQDTGQVSPTAAYWTSSADQQLTLNIWQGIAARYANNPWVAGYDLINEPGGAPSQSALWSAYASLYSGIRAVDPVHLIFMEATWGDWNLDVLPNPSTEGWSNIVYEVHEYQFNNSGDPAAIEAGTNWRVQDFKNHLSWNVPYLVGEFNDFSAGSTPAGVWDYTVQQYQQYNISWTNWAYKTDRGATDSWGIYNAAAAPPPIPNLQTDSAATIQSDWSAWTTARSGQVNSWLEPVLDVNTRGSFSDADIGSPGQLGGSAYDPLSGQWTVLGGGSDIQGTSDRFNFSSQPVSDDQTLVAQVTAVQNTDPWAKAGLMFRASTAANAAYAFVFITPGNGVGFEYRTATGSATAGAGYASSLQAPVWLKLLRGGNTFTAFYSSDGTSWTPVGGAQTIAMSTTIQAGLAVTAHNNSLLNAATFKRVNVLPPDWTDFDLGAPGLPGSATFDGQTWTVAGGGADIWNTSDQFNFVARALPGDGSLAARIGSQDATDVWAKAGVMFRAGSYANAAYVGVLATPGNGLALQWRGSTGAATSTSLVAGVHVPVWVRLVRSGNTFSGYYSADGSTWTQIGTSKFVALPATALAGLAVSAHNNQDLNDTTFAGVSLLPSGWADADIGGPQVLGNATIDPASGVWSVAGGGSDIWNTSDQLHSVWQNLAGDGSVVAQVTSQQATDPWAKAGVMIRAGSDPAASYAGVFVTPSNGVAFQWRSGAGGLTNTALSSGLTAPIWVRLVRVGNSFTGYYSTNGTIWTQVGSSQTLNLPTTALAGLAVSAHNDSLVSSAAFASVAVGPAPFSQYLVTTQVGSVMAGTGFTVAIQAVNAYGDPVTNYTGPTTVTASVSPTTSVSNFPRTVSLNRSGWGIFLANIQTVGTYTITASSGPYAGSAAPVTVTPGPAARLGFAAQPVNTPTGVVLPAVSVQVLDLYGNLVTSDNSDVVTLGIASGPGAFTSGTTISASAHNGLAIFTNLVLTVPGSYTLSAQVPSLYTGPNSVPFTVAPLQVLPGSFAASASGFSLLFNAPFLVNAATPALFGAGFGSSAPAPSVIVTTDPGNLSDTAAMVKGSLLLNPVASSITFVVTNTALQANNGAPLLPAGTYTVIIRGGPAASSFQALNPGGGFLDGLGTGTPGSGDFTTSFTVNPAAAQDTLWVAATADGPGQAVNAPGKNQVGGGYPIYLDDNTGTVTTVQVTLNYDPALLSVSGVTGPNLALLSTSTPGHALLQYSGPALPAGSQTPIGFLTANVPSSTAINPPPYKAVDLLHLSAASLNGGAIPVATSDAVHLVAYVGDADGSGSYSSSDAVLITRVALQTDTGFGAYPLVDPVIVADTDGAGFIPADAALQTNEAGVGVATANLPIPPIPSGATFFSDINTDKARYAPGDQVTVYADLRNSTGNSLSNANVTVYCKYLGTIVSALPVQALSLSPGASTTLVFSWTPPATDFTGYSVEAWLRDAAGNILDNVNTAVDVSSSATRFPRYGYVADYPQQASAVSTHEMWQLKNYHIDLVQYYDWQYKHDVPLAGTAASPAASWTDIAFRTNYRQTILDMINAGHGYNMAAMNYNLIDGAWSGYSNDGVSYQWGLWDSTNGTNQYTLPLPGLASDLYLFNPADPGWQNYIFGREADVFAAYPFDGWHVDSLGSPPAPVYTYSGTPVDVWTTLRPFLNNARSALNKIIDFNNVGGYGLYDTAANSTDDVIYVECWPGSGQVTYADLKTLIDNCIAWSGGKGVVLPAYMDYAYAKGFSASAPGSFNTPGVLLTDATIFASGASHLELGDASSMLDNEYFPNQNLVPSASLLATLRGYYDFQVAYENLLEGRFNNSSNLLWLSVPNSNNASPNSVWSFTKTSGDGTQAMINLINLRGENQIAWRDDNAKYPVPTAQSNITVKYYYGTATVKAVNWASPDFGGEMNFLPTTLGTDSGGNYVQFSVPRLAYWDLIYVSLVPTTGAAAVPLSRERVQVAIATSHAGNGGMPGAALSAAPGPIAFPPTSTTSSGTTGRHNSATLDIHERQVSSRPPVVEPGKSLPSSVHRVVLPELEDMQDAFSLIPDLFRAAGKKGV